MALRRIACPHCEQSVEVDVTHVTRSRDCPNCGNPIIFQFTTKQKRSRRTALMVPSVDPLDELGETPHGDHYGPRPIEGDVLDRMMHDPEVREKVKHFGWGAITVAALIALLSIAHYMDWWSALGRLFTGPSDTAWVETVPSPDSAAPETETESTTAATSTTESSPSSVAPTPTPPSSSSTSVPSSSVASTSTPPLAPPPAPAPPPNESAVMIAPVPGILEEERALKTITAFMNAKDVDERLNYVRDRDKMEPLMRSYYTTHPDGPIPFKLITAEAGSPLNAVVRRFEVTLGDGQKRRATVGRTKLGEYRVDWASLVAYSAMSWDGFMKSKPTAPVFMRVYAQPGDRYEGAYADRARFFCLKLTNPNHPESPPLHAYAPIPSAISMRLNLLLNTFAGDPLPMMFTLKYPPAGTDPAAPATSADQVLIDTLISEGWLTTGT